MLRERARQTESCIGIGYPSGQDGAIVPAWDYAEQAFVNKGFIIWKKNTTFLWDAAAASHKKIVLFSRFVFVVVVVVVVVKATFLFTSRGGIQIYLLLHRKTENSS